MVDIYRLAIWFKCRLFALLGCRHNHEVLALEVDVLNWYVVIQLDWLQVELGSESILVGVLLAGRRVNSTFLHRRLIRIPLRVIL